MLKISQNFHIKFFSILFSFFKKRTVALTLFPQYYHLELLDDWKKYWIGHNSKTVIEKFIIVAAANKGLCNITKAD